MEPWFFFILAALVCYGGIDFTYKAAARADSPSHLVVRTSAFVVAGLSLFAALITGSSLRAWQDIALYAAINSTFFALGSIARISALKKLPAAYVFPVAKLNSVLLILIAVVFFGDRPSPAQWLGIALSVSLVVWVGRGLSRGAGARPLPLTAPVGAGEDDEERLFPREGRMRGFLLALATATCVTISIVAGKFASASVPHFSYMFVSYSLVVLHTLCIERFFTRKPGPAPDDTLAPPAPMRPPAAWFRGEIAKRAYTYGVCIGALNFAGYYLILNALATGPLALIQGISSTSFIIPIALSALIFKERLDLRRSLVIACALLSVVLQH